MRERFVSDELIPVAGTADASAMGRGEPGLPKQFTWRGRRYAVAAVLGNWRTSQREGGRANAGLYLRRHWYRIATDSGDVMTASCERQTRSRKRPKPR